MSRKNRPPFGSQQRQSCALHTAHDQHSMCHEYHDTTLTCGRTRHVDTVHATKRNCYKPPRHRSQLGLLSIQSPARLEQSCNTAFVYRE